MAIVIIPNQPIAFSLPDDSDCGCSGQKFCQIIDPLDPTQFELSSSNLTANGNFDGSLVNWTVSKSLLLTVDVVNTDTLGACHGSVQVHATGGTSPYTYSYNGLPYSSTDFRINLCAGCGFWTVKDSLGVEGSIEYCIDTNIACGDYHNTIDFILVTTVQLNNCITTDFS